jgi:hypothetical protein
VRLGPPEGKKTVTAEELAAIMDQPRRVRALSHLLGNIGDGLNPLIDLYRPYVDGLARLPRDGRFLLVGNHRPQPHLVSPFTVPDDTPTTVADELVRLAMLLLCDRRLSCATRSLLPPAPSSLNTGLQGLALTG